MAIAITGDNQTDEQKERRQARKKLKALRASLKKATFDPLTNGQKFDLLREAVETLIQAQKDKD